MKKSQLEKLIIDDNLYLLKLNHESIFFYNIKRLKLFFKHKGRLKEIIKSNSFCLKYRIRAFFKLLITKY